MTGRTEGPAPTVAFQGMTPKAPGSVTQGMKAVPSIAIRTSSDEPKEVRLYGMEEAY